jgi:hypothetical protein
MSKSTNSSNPNSSNTKKSSIRHTRAIQRDRSKRPTVSPSAASVEQMLTELVHPATYAQIAAYQDMGLRHRTLTLPVMMAFVLSIIWRQIGSVREAVRVLHEEGVLWVAPLSVSQSAVAQRLRTLPAPLFRQVLLDVLPLMQQRWQERQRPLPPMLTWARQHYTGVVAFDGSTLDALLRKVGLLRDLEEKHSALLGGRIASVLDVCSHLPRHILYEADSQAHDQSFWEGVIATLESGLLALFDMGFVNYTFFDRLTDKQVSMLTPLKQNAAVQVIRVLQQTEGVRDCIVMLGQGATRCTHPMRVVEVLTKGKWHRYLTNVTDPQRLPAERVGELYAERWRMEDAFNTIKRVLGLSYLWCGASNAVQVQVWATWILYAVLVDLTDSVAEAIKQPMKALSLEMVFRALYHYTQAHQRDPTLDIVSYLARKSKELGLLKQKRRTSHAQSPI